MHAVVWLHPHIETKTEQQFSVVLYITLCIGIVSSDCSKMSQGENSLQYIIPHVLDLSVTYTIHSNSYCKMHTLSSKAKKEMLNTSALQDSRLATSLQKTKLWPHQKFVVRCKYCWLCSFMCRRLYEVSRALCFSNLKAWPCLSFLRGSLSKGVNSLETISLNSSSTFCCVHVCVFTCAWTNKFTGYFKV